MPPVQKLINVWGLTKQASKGSAGSTPFQVGSGVLSGKVFTLDISQAAEAATLLGAASDRFSPAENRTAILPGAAFKTRATMKVIGRLLYGALGTIADGGGPPYTHTITPAQDLPYWTVASRYGSEYMVTADCKVNELTISWNERNPIEVDVVFLAGAGASPALHGGAWTLTADESTAAYLGPVGGTLQLDTGSASPATARISAASIKISNNLVPVPLSKNIHPDDVFPGLQQIDGTITLIPTDFSDYLKIVTGTGTGTADQATPMYGSFSLLTQIDANNQMTLASLRSAFLIDFPDGDAAGGPMSLDAAFRVVRPTDASAAFTATVKDQVASY